MGRQKDPEQTVENIIMVSAQLFMEKGYEHTSIQDILNTLNLSKGGLYHHFKSKEEILNAVMQKRIQYVEQRFHYMIQNTKAENAKDKLKKIMYQLTSDLKTQTLDMALSSHIEPYFVVNGLQSCMKQDAPIVCKLIEDGMKDGSLQTEQPALCSEVFLMLLNYWVNPALYGRDYEETKDRLYYLQYIMRQLGLDIMDDDVITIMLKVYA